MKDWNAFRQELDDRAPHVARRVVRAFGLRAPPVPVEEVVANLGVRVERRPTPGWDGALVSTHSPPIVWVNGDQRATRQRYAIAHELGHLLMHPTGVYRDATFASGSEQERDANEFALELLIPLWMLEPIITSRRLTTLQVSAMFNVSPGAMGSQLEKLL